jgi:hypothetical protein
MIFFNAKRHRAQPDMFWRARHTRHDPKIDAGNASLLTGQGGLDQRKISGMSTNFGLIVHVLMGQNKQRALKPNSILS